MANIAQQRIQREFREVVKSKEIAESGVQLELVNDDLSELAGWWLGLLTLRTPEDNTN